MKVNANLLNNGNVIRHSNKMYQVINTNIIKPGKGGAYIQVEMRDLISGLKTNERWRTSEKIEKLTTEEVKSTFLFKDNESITLMNNENYEQFQLDISILKERENLLEDGMQLTCVLVDGKIINIRFPKSIEVKLVSADAVVKGQTASTSFKNATTQNGIKVLVPPHIKEGDKILINTENLEYLEKSKS